jgi:Type IV secretion system pilin
MTILKKIIQLSSLLFIFLSVLLIPQAHAAQNLGEVFNFFDVKCLVPNGVIATGLQNAGKPDYNDANTDGVTFKHRICQGGGASLLDQAVNFLLQLGPVLAVIVVLWGGFLYYNSVFDGDNARAQKTVVAGVTGLAIIQAVPLIYTIFQEIGANNVGSSKSLFDNLTTILINSILRPAANAGIILGAAAAVVSFVFAGYQYLLNDPKKGQTALINAAIGLGVVIGSVAIVALIQTTAGLVTK